jgi:ParB-like chromosome segregation protein Spo0J
MKTEIIDIKKIKPNKDNPRVIKDDNFEKLMQSIKDFPEMLDIRPVVLNKKMIILGGNMRYKAAKEAGLKKIPAIIVNLSPEKEREFIIKDNVSGGDWDFDLLRTEWSNEDLAAWGLDMPKVDEGGDPEDISSTISTEYKIEIVCKSEEEQEKVYNKLI